MIQDRKEKNRQKKTNKQQEQEELIFTQIQNIIILYITN